MPAIVVLAMVSALALGQPHGGAGLEREAHVIDETLMSPCCYTQQVSIHKSAVADEVRRDIRARLAAGESRQQILDAYVAQYGKRILAEPPAEGFDRALYVAPVLILVLSVVLVAVVVRQFTRRRGPPLAAAGGAGGALTSTEAARLDDELRELD